MTARRWWPDAQGQDLDAEVQLHDATGCRRQVLEQAGVCLLHLLLGLCWGGDPKTPGGDEIAMGWGYAPGAALGKSLPKIRKGWHP